MGDKIISLVKNMDLFVLAEVQNVYLDIKKKKNTSLTLTLYELYELQIFLCLKFKVNILI